MKQIQLYALAFSILGGCAETVYTPDDAVGTARLPSYFVVSSSNSAQETLDCVLREVSLSNNNNTFEYAYTSEGWEIDVIYGKNGVVGGGQIGKIIKDSEAMTFYYRRAIGNFGMDAWNVERVIPQALTDCS